MNRLTLAIAVAIACNADAQITELWKVVSDGSPARVIALPGGDVLIGGSRQVGFVGSSALFDAFVERYDADGNPVWKWQSKISASDTLADFGVDDQGNVYIASTVGTSVWGLQPWAWMVARINPSGGVDWSDSYQGTGTVTDAEAVRMAVDGSGTVAVVGTDHSTGPSTDIVLGLWDAAGNHLWTSRHVSTAWDQPWDVRFGPSGEIYVSGEAGAPTGSIPDYALMRFNSDGTQAWVRRHPGNAGINGRADAIAITPQGNIAATGNVEYLATAKDAFTVLYDPSGNLLWVRTYDGASHSFDRGYDLAVGADGSVFVTGEEFVSWSFVFYDIPVIAYGPSGQPLWTDRFGSSPTINESEDQALNIATLPGGDVVVLACDRTKPGPDYIIRRYSPTGSLIDQRSADVPGGDVWFERNNLDIDPTGRFAFVLGWGSGFQPQPAWSSVLFKIDLGSSPCYPDCDQNATLDLFDFLCFTNAFNAGDPYADCDANATLDLFDFLCFTNAFNAGCS